MTSTFTNYMTELEQSLRTASALVTLNSIVVDAASETGVPALVGSLIFESTDRGVTVSPSHISGPLVANVWKTSDCGVPKDIVELPLTGDAGIDAFSIAEALEL